jgi:hypothetical protein
MLGVPVEEDREGEDGDGGNDDERERDVGEEGASILRVERVSGPLDDRLGSKGHGWTVIPAGMVRHAPEMDGADIVPQSLVGAGGSAGSGVTLRRDVRNQ